MKISVNIINLDDSFVYAFADKTDDGYFINFTFSNEDTYKKFLTNKKIKFIYDIENDKVMKNLIKSNMAKIKQIMPIYAISNLMDIKRVDNVILDIGNLSWKEKKYVINNIATNSTYFIDTYSFDEVLSLNDITCMYNIIEFLIEDLKDKSPLEQLYCIYALLKDRPYLPADVENNKYLSRSLNHVLYTNFIVCAGYANLFSAMCDALGINNEFTSWPKDSSGHSNNICYVNDSKYDIVGIFAMDITLDVESNRILHFLYPMDKETIEKSFNGYDAEETTLYYSLIGKYNSYLQYKQNSYPLPLLENLKRLITSKINKIYQLLNLDYLVDANCDIEEEMEKIKNYANVYISPFALRKIIDIADLEYSLEVIKTSFHYKALHPEDKLMVDVLWNCNRKL